MASSGAPQQSPSTILPTTTGKTAISRTLPNCIVEKLVFDREGSLDEITFQSSSTTLNISLSLTRPGSILNYPGHWPKDEFRQVGRVMLVPPGVAMTVRPSPERKELLRLSFRDEELGGPDYWTDARLRSAISVRPGSIVQAGARIAAELTNPGLSSDLMIESLCQIIMIDLRRALADEKLASSGASGGLQSWRVQIIQELARGHEAFPPLDEVASLCRMSKRQLLRAFKDETGLTIGAFVRQERIRHAKELLAGYEQPIEDIAALLGYGSPSSFSAAFKATAGMTPREFRKGIRQ